MLFPKYYSPYFINQSSEINGKIGLHTGWFIEHETDVILDALIIKKKRRFLFRGGQKLVVGYTCGV